jgi:hypothetical protein
MTLAAKPVALKKYKISVGMLVKQYSIFWVIYFMLAPLRIAHFGG